MLKLATYHMTEGDAGIGCKLINECMIMSGKQRATVNSVTQLANNSTGDSIAVVSGCTTTCSTAQIISC